LADDSSLKGTSIMMRLFSLLTPLFAFALLGCNASSSVLSSTQGFPQGTGFIKKTVTVDNVTRQYTVFIPANYNPNTKLPAIVFLHGVLESGSDAEKNLGVGIGPHIGKAAQSWQFITLFPQSTGDWQGDFEQRLAIACLDQCQRDYAIDPDRVFLTGLSNGGQGTWIIGARYKDRFAGLAPMCGQSAYDACPNLTGIPIWCFHNSVDPFVMTGQSREMCKRIKEAGGNVKYTEFDAFGHGCWDRAYDEGEVLKWMVATRRNGHPNGKSASNVP
jgi:predicted peptidase